MSLKQFCEKTIALKEYEKAFEEVNRISYEIYT